MSARRFTSKPTDIMEEPVLPPPPAPTLRLNVIEAWAESPLYGVLRAAHLGTPIEESYRLPGQFLSLSVAGATEELVPRYFAIASSPRAPHLEFLIKRGAPTADALVELSAGDHIMVSDVLGEGFPIEPVRGRDLVMFATGSGIAPVVSLLEYIASRPSLRPRSMWLYYGEHRLEEFAYAARLEALAQKGLNLFKTAGHEPAKTDGLRFVQDAFARHRPPMDDAAVYLCGSPIMEEAVTEALAEYSLDEERIFRNY